MKDREIIKIMGWTNKDGHSEMGLRRARDLVEAARRERENEIRETAWLDGREAFEREMKRQGYDAQTTSAGVYRWPEVQAMWKAWEMMRTRAAAQGLFGGKEGSMTPTQQQAADLAARLILSDCLAALRAMPDSSVDSIVTDPPYGISFMGARWDYDVPSEAIWRECLRVLKPGGYLLAFASTRTQHRMVCRIEDAGFEIHDMIAWVSAQGMPKHHSKLKPAIEPITIARKPAPRATLLNIDACRVPPVDDDDDAAYRTKCDSVVGLDRNRNGVCYGEMSGERRDSYSVEGRYPANLIHDGSNAVLALFPDSAGAGGSVPNVKISGYGDGIGSGASEYLGGERTKVDSGSGSAARFFYCAKASRRDRGEDNDHPTVKPTALMRYLCRLVTPPGGTVLDPFMGSGSTGKAAVIEGFRFIGIEREPEYFAIAQRRVHEPDAEDEQDRHADKGQIPLFANEEQGEAA